MVLSLSDYSKPTKVKSLSDYSKPTVSAKTNSANLRSTKSKTTSPPRDTEYVSKGISLPKDMRLTPSKSSKNIESTTSPNPTPSGGTGGSSSLNWKDSAYTRQMGAIQRALQEFETGAQQRADRYGIDFGQGVNRLGYRMAPDFQSMGNILEARPGSTLGDVMGRGEWDLEGNFDPYTAAAKGTRGTRDEFAGRGMLRSSDFVKTFGDFQNRLNQQLEDMNTGRTRFYEDTLSELTSRRTTAEEEQQAAKDAARARAIAKAAASLGG
jgi:hypothetical protein